MVYEGILKGDSCVGGADMHMWYLYVGIAKGIVDFQEDEVVETKWVNMDSIDKNTITFPLRFFLDNEKVVKYIKSLR